MGCRSCSRCLYRICHDRFTDLLPLVSANGLEPESARGHRICLSPTVSALPSFLESKLILYKSSCIRNGVRSPLHDRPQILEPRRRRRNSPLLAANPALVFAHISDDTMPKILYQKLRYQLRQWRRKLYTRLLRLSELGNGAVRLPPPFNIRYKGGD